MRRLLLLLITLLPLMANAYNAYIDGIYYNFSGDKAAVTYKDYNYNSYSGDVVIPSSVTFNDKTYSVTSIGDAAFSKCSDLTSVIIGKSVTSIGSNAFESCSGLTSITIPNSVTSIGSGAFGGTAWYNNQPDGVVYAGKVAYNYKGTMAAGTQIEIQEGTLGIADNAFGGCSSLTSVIIPNSVTKISSYAFSYCTGLTSIIIPNSVTSIEGYAFYKTNIKKVIWLTNTPPNGYENVKGTINYVANNQYSSLSNVKVYPYLSSLFEVDGIKYVPVSPSERTCDAIDCAYNESAENINIGETVTYNGITLTVRQINPYLCSGNSHIKDVNLTSQCDVAAHAFYGCTGLSEVTISNQGNIGEHAFYNCTNLNKAIINNQGGIENEAFSGCSSLQIVELGEEITSIGSYAFSGCKKMECIVIPDAAETIGNHAFENCSAMTSVKLGNGVKTIPTYAFSDCSSLPIIQIPQNVTTISDYVFSGCTRLKTILMDNGETELSLGSNGNNSLFYNCPLDSVYIGRNITYQTTSDKGYSPFYRNTSLRSVAITDKETEIPANEFYGCTNLKDVRIGDGVTTIGDYAFSGCSNLDSFAFGSSVESIGKEAFSDCNAMTSLVSKAIIPPTCGSQALDDINKWNCTLTVPEGHLTAYQQADQWKEFFFINEGNGDDTPIIPDPEKCATPTISYANGELKFNCETENVQFISKITDDDIKSYYSDKIELGVTYTITVYATKTGYIDSDVVTATLCWIDQQPATEGIVEEDAVTEVKAMPVLIQTQGGTITIQGAFEGTPIAIYGVDGKKYGTTVADKGSTTIATSLQPGSVAVDKIGEKAVKVLLK